MYSMYTFFIVSDLRDVSGESFINRCFTFGTKEMLLITLITSLSLFIYDGIQVKYI